MKSFSFNVLSLGGSDIGSRLISFLAVTYLARTLGPENIGILAIGMAILTYASILSSMGLPLLGVRSIAAKKGSMQDLVKRICSARFLLSIISFIVITVILMLLVKEQNARNVAIIFLITLFPSALMLGWLFQGLGDMKTLAIGQLLGMFAYLLFIVGIVLNSEDIYWVPCAWCFGLLIQTIYFWINYKKLCILENSENKPLHLIDIIRQGIPLGIAALISQTVIQFPFIYLGFFDTSENTGLYSVAFRVVVLMLAIDRIFYTIFFPVISRSFKDSLEHLNAQVSWTLKIVITSSLYIALLALIAGKDLLPIFFGSEFRNASLIFQALLGYFALTVINSVFTFTLIGIEKEHLYTKALFISVIAFVVIILIPIPLSATLIAPIALAVHQGVSMLIMMKYIRKSIYINLLFRTLLPLSIAIVFALFIYIWQHLYPVIVSATVVLLALPAIAIASGINRNDINTLKVLLK